MFKIFVTYTAKDSETAKAFYKEVKEAGVIEASRAEEGNISYDYYFPADSENQLFLLERWQDESAQKYHATLDHFKKLGELKEGYGIQTHIVRE